MIRHTRLLVILLLTLAAALVGLQSPASAATSSRAWDAPGPYAVTVAPGDSAHTIYRPANLTGDHPVIIWGNGTGATPADYDTQLRHLASWGFIVAAANTTESGSGEEMLAGAHWLIAEDQRAGSDFYGHVDEDKIGAAGHSQGGGGAIAAGADPLVDTVVPIMPGPQGTVSAIRGPAFYIAGQYDYIVPSLFVQGRYYGTTQVPAVFGELKGSDHLFTDEAVRPIAISAVTGWFRYWLMGDTSARSVFFGADCGMCTDTTGWSQYLRNEKASALPG